MISVNSVFIYKYLLNIYYVQSSVLGTMETTVSKKSYYL